MKILLSGGGTLGSVSPLLAVYQAIKQRDSRVEFLWVATRKGPEHQLIASYHIPIKAIHSGKLRRYWSLKNFFDPLLVLVGFFESLSLIKQYQPDFILTAGGFVSVPLVWAARLIGKKVLVHQQDVRPGLANRLMASSATVITATFQQSANQFGKKKVQVVGNPIRSDLVAASKEQAYQFFKLDPETPTVLFIGGGTGALALNQLVFASLEQLVAFCQVIHLTGGKIDTIAEHSLYRSFDFLSQEIAEAYAVADVVVSRAGLSVLTELSVLGKAAILVPLPGSHQVDNATEFAKRNAAIVLPENKLTPQLFVAAVKSLITDQTTQQMLRHNIRTVMPVGAAEKITNIIFTHV